MYKKKTWNFSKNYKSETYENTCQRTYIRVIDRHAI